MATVTAIDYRRTDLRKNVLYNPYWISSGEVVCADAEDLAAILFSFPASQGVVVVHEIGLQITTACTASTPSGTLGMGSIATDDITTGGVVTTVGVDDFLVTADVTWTSTGFYWATSGSDFLTAKAAGSLTGPTIITGADSTVPVIVAYPAHTSSFLAGKFRVHALISHLPGSGW